METIKQGVACHNEENPTTLLGNQYKYVLGPVWGMWWVAGYLFYRVSRPAVRKKSVTFQLMVTSLEA